MKNMVNLGFNEVPTQWYNIIPDLPESLPPPRDPEDGPSRVKNLPNLMIGECLNQEFSKENWIDIPGGIMDLYSKAGRPRPLFRATHLEKKLGTPARMYYKGEFFSPTGSHKVNTALAQCWYAKQQGFERVTTETGAGQWGTALSYAAAVTGLKCTVYWVRRTAPSAGALYPLEVYLAVGNVDGIGKGIYKYKPHEHGLVKIADRDVRDKLNRAAVGQSWVAYNAVVLVLAAVFERTTSKYGQRGKRYEHIEVGHVAQNVYLQVVSLNLGTVIVGAFQDDEVKKIMMMEKLENPMCIMPIGRK